MHLASKNHKKQTQPLFIWITFVVFVLIDTDHKYNTVPIINKSNLGDFLCQSILALCQGPFYTRLSINPITKEHEICMPFRFVGTWSIKNFAAA